MKLHIVTPLCVVLDEDGVEALCAEEARPLSLRSAREWRSRNSPRISPAASCQTEKECAMVAYAIFIKSGAQPRRTRSLQRDGSRRSRGSSDHVPHRARTQGIRFRARGSGRLQFGLRSDDEESRSPVQLRVA